MDIIRDLVLGIRGNLALASGHTSEIEVELRFYSKINVWNYFQLVHEAEIYLGDFLKRMPEECSVMHFIFSFPNFFQFKIDYTYESIKRRLVYSEDLTQVKSDKYWAKRRLRKCVFSWDFSTILERKDQRSEFIVLSISREIKVDHVPGLNCTNVRQKRRITFDGELFKLDITLVKSGLSLSSCTLSPIVTEVEVEIKNVLDTAQTEVGKVQ